MPRIFFIYNKNQSHNSTYSANKSQTLIFMIQYLENEPIKTSTL